MDIGVQFYTLRKQCTNLEEFAESLKRVAEMGYTTVQISGTCDYEPEWLKEQLEKNNLRCVLTHIKRERFSEEPEKILADHKIFDCSCIGLGAPYNMLKEGEADFEKTCALIDKAAPIFKEGRAYFMYHHHAMEFMRSADGRTYFDRLLEKYDASLLGFTLDTYWLQAAGKNPAEVIRSLKGRIPCVHLKDMGVAGNDPIMQSVGGGNLNWADILAACEEAGVEHLLVEQDNCNGEDPFACLERSYKFLKERV